MKTATLNLRKTRESRAAAAAVALNPKEPLSLKSIVVPIDFSKSSAKALAYAEVLAKQFDARLTLLFVVEPVESPDFALSFPMMLEPEELISNCKGKLEKFAREHTKRSLVEKVLVRRGRPFHEICEASRTLKADLIVISTHGYSGLNRAIMGSVTERVVRHAPCPVLVVRETERDFVSI